LTPHPNLVLALASAACVAGVLGVVMGLGSLIRALRGQYRDLEPAAPRQRRTAWTGVVLLAASVALSFAATSVAVLGHTGPQPKGAATARIALPWFVGAWLHHGVELLVSPGQLEGTSGYIGDLQFRTYADCQIPHTSPPCDTTTGNLIVEGGLVRVLLDADGFGAVINSDMTGVDRGDQVFVYEGPQNDTLYVQDVTHPTSSLATLTLCGPKATTNACGA